MLPLRHNNKTNLANQMGPPTPSLVRKSSRPSLSCRDLPYNGSASYYKNMQPTYLDVPPPQFAPSHMPSTTEFRKRTRPTFLHMLDSNPNKLSVPAPVHPNIQKLTGRAAGPSGPQNYGWTGQPIPPRSPILDQVLTTELRPGPNVVWFCEKKRDNGKFWTYRKKLFACGIMIFLIFGLITCKGFGFFTRDVRDSHHLEMEEDETIKEILPSSVPNSVNTPPPNSLENVEFTHKPKEKIIEKLQSNAEPDISTNVSNGSNIIITDDQAIVPTRPAIIRIMYSVNEDLESMVEIVEG